MTLFIAQDTDSTFTVRPGENTLQAAASALVAEGWADAAAISAATAEAAAGPTYASTAAGLAATTSGQAFAVDVGGGLVSVYLNSAGSAVLQRTLATTAYANATYSSKSDLAASGGAGLVGHIATGAGAVARTVQSKLRDTVSVKDFGAVGDGVTDDSAAFTAAFSTGKAVFVPIGTYALNYLSMPSNLVMFGEGDTSVIKPTSSVIRAALTIDSGSASTFVKGPTLFNLRFEGAEAVPTFDQQKHLITMHGVDGVSIYNCTFKGWRGDAIYFGSSDTFTLERHNRNIRVFNCRFDGVNRENRQAMSFIDVDGAWIENNDFVNCTKAGMPGVIDFEPNDQSWHIIKNIWVKANKFTACGGNAGTITVFNPSTAMPAFQNVWIEDNTQIDSRQNAGGGFVWITRPETITSTSLDNNIRVLNNRAVGGDLANSRPFYINGVRGVVSAGNVYEDHPGSAFIAFANSVADVAISDTFRRCGFDGGIRRAVQVGAVDGLDFTGSEFEDCVNSTAGTTYLFRFASGVGARIKLNSITILDPSGVLDVLVEAAAYTFDAATNEHFNCDWPNLPNAFQAHQSDRIWTAFTSLVQGSTSAGTGTYTKRFGRWRRIGKQVFFELEIIQTAHTGTGMIEIQLPTAVAADSGSGLPDLKPIPISLDGVSTTGGQIGLINPTQNIAGLGKLRCYHSGSGTLAQTIVPAGSATYRAAGSYMAAL